MAKKTTKKVEKIWATGRRKKAIARARISEGKGEIVINKKPLNEYFKSELLQNEVETEQNSQEDDIYDTESTDVINRLFLGLRKSCMELISNQARHAGNKRAEAAQIRTDNERLSIFCKCR